MRLITSVMRHASAGLLAAAALALAACTAAAPPADLTRIRYDNQCMTLDGKDTFIYSGAFHYFRCPKELWRDRLAKMKEAGLNCVETYVAWNYHEPEMPASLDDTSKFVRLNDLNDFITLAEDMGFYVIIRPGPYICAEWASGGFPRWLYSKRPESDKIANKYWVRGDEATYQAWCKHYIRAIAQVVKPHQLTHRAPGKTGVIMWQIENEYDFFGGAPAVKFNHLKALAESAHEFGIDVPLITCVTKNKLFRQDPLLRSVIETSNRYPGYNMTDLRNQLRETAKYQPEKFAAVTELQGGWFSNVGGQLSEDQGLNAAQINQITLLCMEEGLTSINYYMFFGGTNMDDWGARYMTSTYDYNAPIREWGSAGPRYRAVQAIGAMLREHAAQLTRTQKVACTSAEGLPPGVQVTVREARDGSRYVFVRNEDRAKPRQGQLKLQVGEPGSELSFEYDLGAFGARVLYLPPGVTDAAKGQWLPKEIAAPERPTNLPAPVAITEARRQQDFGPSYWRKITPGQTLDQVGINHAKFVFYRAQLAGDAALADGQAAVVAAIPEPDAALLCMKGQILRSNGREQGFAKFTPGRLLGNGSNQVVVLYENSGYSNGGPPLDGVSGLTGLSVVAERELGGRAVNSWQILYGPPSADRRETAESVDTSSWQTVDVSGPDGQMKVNTTAILRTTLDLAAEEMGGTRELVFKSIDDEAEVFVNGVSVGKSMAYGTPFRVKLASPFRAGKNSVALIVKNNAGVGGIVGGVKIAAAPKLAAPAKLEFSDEPAGVVGRWWRPELDDSSWAKVAVARPETNGAADPGTAKKAAAGELLESPLTWYRLSFETPALPQGIWAPFRIRLMARGNGFVYLNGHALGRYWEIGPQRDFYLPECWLAGPGKKNVVTLCLRPTEGPVSLESAEISVYPDSAEFR